MFRENFFVFAMRFFLPLLFLFFSLGTAAEERVKSWPALSDGQCVMAQSFIDMPESITPYITPEMREDMVDYFAVGSKKGVTNLLMGESAVEEITDYSFTIKLASGKSVLSVRKYFTSKNDSLYVTIKTVSTPAPDSAIKFFDSQWNLLDDNKMFVFPEAKDFFDKPGTEDSKSAIALINITLLKLSFTSEGNIDAEISTDFLPDEIKDRITPLISDKPKTYSWNGKRFVEK